GGRWRRLEAPAEQADILGQEELVKDRVRLLLGRYGVLFRELLKRELPAFQWSRVFRTLRLMELSGEVLAGCFFHGVRGLQFIAHGAFRDLEKGLPRDAVYWMCAADPASLAGVEIEGVKERLPPRLMTTHLVFRGTEPVLISKRRGKHLDVRVEPDYPALTEYLAPLEHLLTREFQPLSSIAVETICEQPAATSPYARRLEQVFRTVREGPVLRLWKRF
ncbi:MAG: ATP-dependent helicase, partial [Acidobacteriota bacterium]